MSSYLGHYAQLYDEIYVDKTYGREVEFISKYLKSRCRILELACGTGTHALLFEKRGFTVKATDYSDSMLAVAKKKAAAMKSSILFKKMDMRKIPNFPQKFDAILCLFDSIGYVQTNDAIEQVLKGVRKNLNNNGLFIFEFWYAPAMIRYFDPLRKRTFHLSNKHVLQRISKTTLDYKMSTATVEYTLDEYDGRKKIYHIEETQQNRFFSIPEMELLLDMSGLTPIKFFSGYSENEIISDSSFHILCLARNKPL